jgi:hypothetical protein
MDNVRAVDEEIRAAGAWVFTGGLHEPSTAIVLSPRARRCRSLTGPTLRVRSTSVVAFLA